MTPNFLNGQLKTSDKYSKGVSMKIVCEISIQAKRIEYMNAITDKTNLKGERSLNYNPVGTTGNKLVL